MSSHLQIVDDSFNTFRSSVVQVIATSMSCLRSAFAFLFKKIIELLQNLHKHEQAQS
jgi:hypothetical protein